VNLTIYENMVTAIIGKSGVGKSVFLKHIIGLLQPSAGDIYFMGKKMSEMTRDERKELKRNFSYMFQNNALFDSMTLFENIALPLKERTKMKNKEIKNKVMELTEQLEISEVVERYPSQVSGGMQKRAALARALITNPRIVLFDEPTTGLDPLRKNAVLSMISHYQKKFGFTAVVVSHDIPDIFYISNRIAIIDNAKILFEGSPVELEQSKHTVIKQFINSLEGLKDDLTGLHTKRHIEDSFHRQMRLLEDHGDAFTVMLLTIENLDGIKENVGHISAQRIIQGLADLTKQHLDNFGESGRFSTDKIIAVLPRTSIAEAKVLRVALAKSLQGRAIANPLADTNACFTFSIRAGLAQAAPGMTLPQLVMEAEHNQASLAELECVSEDAAA
jgi:phospholipid/cholesterol/gamma-HCH transport system ATP-binding protein